MQTDELEMLKIQNNMDPKNLQVAGSGEQARLGLCVYSCGIVIGWPTHGQYGF